MRHSCNANTAAMTSNQPPLFERRRDQPAGKRFFACMILVLCLALPLSLPAQEERGALVTVLEGKAILIKSNEKRPLSAFERLEANDIIDLRRGRLTLVFFLTGRQETWRGAGKIELGPGEGTGVGLSPPETKTLAPFLVKQIARTPMLLAQGRAGAVRLRAIATPEAIAEVEETYQRLRMEAASDDLTPEMYRLSALFEMRAYDALAISLRELEMLHPHHKEARLLASLYRKALPSAQERE